MISNKRSWMLILGIVSLFSCKEKSYLDQNALPIVDGINVFQEDTFSIIATNILRDSLWTSYLNGVALGNCKDYPYTGPVRIDAAIQFKLPDEQFVFTGTNPQIDSIILVLPYGEMYRDSLNPGSDQRFEVYKLNQPFDTAVDLYSFTDVAHGTTIWNQDPSKGYNYGTYKDSVKIWGNSLIPHMRVRMSEAFVDEFRNANDSVLKTSVNFIKWLPGLFIKSVENNANGIGYFSLSKAGLEVHFHSNEKDSLITTFPYAGAYGEHYSRVYHDYDAAILNSAMNPNPEGEEWTYVSFNPGIKTKLEIPYLASLENYIINDAVIEVIAEKGTNYFPVLTYMLPMKFTDSNLSITRDYDFDLSSYTGYALGQREDITLPNGEDAYKYTMRITKELSHATILKKSLVLQLGEREFNALLQYTPPAKNLTRIGGNNRSDDYKLKLKILYSKK